MPTGILNIYTLIFVYSYKINLIKPPHTFLIYSGGLQD